MKISEVFPLTMQGIFFDLNDSYPERYPWAGREVDILYISHSGNKTVAPIVEILLRLEPYERDEFVNSVAHAIDNMYGDKWDRIYKALTTDYELLQNYFMSETETPDITHTSERKTATDMETNSTGNSNASGYGFNSVSPVPQASSDATTGQRLHGDANKNVENMTETETGTRIHERKGLTETPQQIIVREIELRKQNFIAMVIADTDRLITCPMYE